MKIDGIKLKSFREESGKTVAEIAFIADLTPQRISQIEKGKDTRLNNNIARAIAKALGVKPEQLV